MGARTGGGHTRVFCHFHTGGVGNCNGGTGLSGWMQKIEIERASDVADGSVVRRVLRGDVNAYEELLVKYSDVVEKVVRRHVPPGQVGEVAHEVFVSAYGSLETFMVGRSFRNWLITIAVRGCYEFWRREARWRERPVSSYTHQGEAPSAEWMEGLLSEGAHGEFHAEETRQMAIEALGWALGVLSPQERMVLELYYLEGYSTRQVASFLKMSQANVKVKAYRSRKKLKRILEKNM